MTRRHRLLLALAIWAGFGLVCLIGTYAHAGYVCTPHQYERGECLPIIKSRGQIPQGIQRILATNPNCEDVLALVAWVGEAKAEAVARAAGATDRQIARARRCLSSSR